MTFQIEPKRMDSAVKGVRLLGWDIPTIISASEEKLRVIAAVECCDPSLAPAVVAVVVRYEVKTSVLATM